MKGHLKASSNTQKLHSYYTSTLYYHWTSSASSPRQHSHLIVAVPVLCTGNPKNSRMGRGETLINKVVPAGYNNLKIKLLCRHYRENTGTCPVFNLLHLPAVGRQTQATQTTRPKQIIRTRRTVPYSQYSQYRQYRQYRPDNASAAQSSQHVLPTIRQLQHRH